MKTILSAKMAALMAAGNFIQGYTPDDLKKEKFSTSFEAEFGGQASDMEYCVYFDKKGNATRMNVEIWLANGNLAEFTKDYKQAMSAGVRLINEFTESYEVTDIQDTDTASIYDDRKDDVFERMMFFKPFYSF